MTRILLYAAAAALLPSAAFAEVLDKEFHISWYWSKTGAFLVIAVALALWRPWAGLIVWVLWIGFAAMMLLHVHDPLTGPAIWHEDPTYHPQVYVCLLLGFVAVPLTIHLRHRRRNSRASQKG